MATTLTIGGTSIDLALYPLGKLVAYHKGGVPSLAVYRRGEKLPGLPDPWLGKEAVLAIGGTTYFKGRCVSAQPDIVEGLGWVIAYQCLGLRHYGDLVPLTDDNTGLDSCAFNLNPTDTANYIASRAGRTVGEILAQVLTMLTNAQNLANYGLGDYSGLPSAPALPATTVADLAALTLIPPGAVYLSGEKLLGAIEGFLDEWAPNHALWIDPANGDLRILDTRTFANHTFTMGADPISPSALTRDVGDCFQSVLIRGQAISEAWLLSLSNGQLEEDFAWGSLSSSAAKAAFSATAYGQQGSYQDKGTCTCPSTTTVTVTSSDPSATWVANFWDQTSTGAAGVVNVLYSAGSGLTQQATRRIVACTALAAGGTSTLTLDLPLPITGYDKYTISGQQGGATVVYRKYKATNAAVGAALQTQFSYEQALSNASGSAASLSWTPIGSVVYGTSSPYKEFPVPFTQDPSSGTFLFVSPTYIMAGNSDPVDVRIWAAVATGVNHAYAPALSGGVQTFGGDSHTLEVLSDTLVVTCPAWRDPGQLAQVEAWASDILDSVKNGVMEGSIRYLGLYTPALTMGVAASIAGSGYTTGWESAAVPVLSVEVEWGYTGALDHTTTLHCSSRKAHYGQGAFLRPERTGLPIGGDFNPYGDLVAHGVGLGTGAATSAEGLAAGLAGSAIAPDLSGVATNPGNYLAAQGVPSSMADLGLPTSPADLGIPTSPDDIFGGGS